MIWLVSSAFDRWPLWCVRVTWRDLPGHRVLTADTLTIEAHSDVRACANGTSFKAICLVGFADKNYPARRRKEVKKLYR